MSTVNHSAAAGIHPGAYVQSGDPGAVGAGILWIDTSGSAPFPLKKRNSGNTGWDLAGGVTTAFVASGGSHAAGLVPDPGSSAGTTKFLREDASWQVPAGGGLTGGNSYRSTDVTMSSANTAYDALSVTPAAGTYLINFTVTIKSGATNSQITGKIWDGTTNLTSCEGMGNSSLGSVTLTSSVRVTTAGSTTYTVRCYAADANAVIKAACVDNAAGNTATHLDYTPCT